MSAELTSSRKALLIFERFKDRKHDFLESANGPYKRAEQAISERFQASKQIPEYQQNEVLS